MWHFGQCWRATNSPIRLIGTAIMYKGINNGQVRIRSGRSRNWTRLDIVSKPRSLSDSLWRRRRMFGSQGLNLFSEIANPNYARLDDAGVDAAKIELSANRRIDELRCIYAEPRYEFLTACMRLIGYFDH